MTETLHKHAAGQGCAVATGHPEAAAAARAMLHRNGSAVDAAIAADAVLGVVEPMATSIGGDLLAMIVPVGQAPICYNGTGRSPRGLHASLVRALPGGRIPERHPYAVTVPGAVQGWQDLHHRFGRLPWADLFAPAIRLARDGYAIAPVAAREWGIFDFVLHGDPGAQALYRAGHPPNAGGTIANPALGDVLAEIAVSGPDAFYRGATAHAIAAGVQARGGVLTAADMGEHTGFFCTPLSTRVGEVLVHQCPPNTHGVAILEALDSTTAAAMSPAGQPDEADPDGTIALVRATSSAMANASRTVADPAGNTVCTVIVDEQGLAITLMSSIFKRFGSAIVPPGLGFALQNRGFGFAEPGHINGAAPAKRPYHTVVPGASTRDGRFYLGMGVVGGLMQPQGQIQLLTRMLVHGETPAHAIGQSRWRLEAKDTLALEDGMPIALAQRLRAVFPAPAAAAGELAGRSDFGGAQIVMSDGAGGYLVSSDPRKDGVAWVARPYAPG